MPNTANALVRGPLRVGDQRAVAGRHGGGPGARQGTRGDQHRDVAGERGDQHRGGEHRHSPGEHAAPPDPVGQRPGARHERGEGEEEGVHHPLHGGGPGMQVRADVGQRLGRAGGGHRDEQQGSADDGQHGPASHGRRRVHRCTPTLMTINVLMGIRV
ncbi:hypothetical protein HNR61_004386 [Actinomadura namibiensis]|uniref:Uncharacterized protein n=1 Tax=Actinomadura namibiensis TaxID=182080 RepID=A0A7W3LRA5_ACTNM|nr:hypothetical protein [Actinomadura namibiensis]MBA8952740.1 hypothetical protein [Actinomadura namibiensis]